MRCSTRSRSRPRHRWTAIAQRLGVADVIGPISPCHQQVPPSASMSFARRRGSSRDHGASAIASSRRRASARCPRFCQNRHIENASGIAIGGSGARDCPVEHGAYVVVIRSSRSSHARCSSPESSGAARAARAVNQSRWRDSTRSRSPPAAEVFGGEVADRLEQPEARLPVGHRIDLDEALIDEAR